MKRSEESFEDNGEKSEAITVSASLIRGIS